MFLGDLFTSMSKWKSLFPRFWFGNRDFNFMVILKPFRPVVVSSTGTPSSTNLRKHLEQEPLTITKLLISFNQKRSFICSQRPFWMIWELTTPPLSVLSQVGWWDTQPRGRSGSTSQGNTIKI